MNAAQYDVNYNRDWSSSPTQTPSTPTTQPKANVAVPVQWNPDGSIEMDNGTTVLPNGTVVPTTSVQSSSNAGALNQIANTTPTIANGGVLIPVYAENGDPIPAPTPQIDNASNYQMAYDMGLEQSYDPNFNYADLYYNGTYSNIYGDPYSGGFSNLF